MKNQSINTNEESTNIKKIEFDGETMQCPLRMSEEFKYFNRITKILTTNHQEVVEIISEMKASNYRNRCKLQFNLKSRPDIVNSLFATSATNR